MEAYIEIEESFVRAIVTAGAGCRFAKLGSGGLAISRTVETLRHINSLIPAISRRLREGTEHLIADTDLQGDEASQAAYAWGIAFCAGEGADIADELHKKYVAESN